MAIGILDVGQCGFDGPRMAGLWRDKLDATVDRVASGKDAAQRLNRGGYHVFLVRLQASNLGYGGTGLQPVSGADDGLETRPTPKLRFDAALALESSKSTIYDNSTVPNGLPLRGDEIESHRKESFTPVTPTVSWAGRPVEHSIDLLPQGKNFLAFVRR
jgi:hypothetical protein